MILEAPRCHTRSTEFMIHIFKHPIIMQNRLGKACNGDILKPMRMPKSLYNQVKEFLIPAPIPKPKMLGDTDLALLLDLHRSAITSVYYQRAPIFSSEINFRHCCFRELAARGSKPLPDLILRHQWSQLLWILISQIWKTYRHPKSRPWQESMALCYVRHAWDSDAFTPNMW